jgi:hypothetical protein
MQAIVPVPIANHPTVAALNKEMWSLPLGIKFVAINRASCLNAALQDHVVPDSTELVDFSFVALPSPVPIDIDLAASC